MKFNRITMAGYKKIKVHGLQTLNENQFSKQILKFKQWQKNLSKGINPI